MIDQSFWNGKRVLITGHTGFKGAWLSLWLHSLGAEVTGFALDPPTTPSLYEIGGLSGIVRSIVGDVRSRDQLQEAVRQAKPDIVIHMAAQPLVRASYVTPVETYETNVMGTVHLLDAVRTAVADGIAIRAVLNVTTDKCYENREWHWGYREQDTLGGYDPYSNSKACSELVTASYRNSFFGESAEPDGMPPVAIATARAGNVIGGGDWATDRLIPDSMRALLNGQPIVVRHPSSIRPWQHVLEPLSGYLLLLQHMVRDPKRYSESWNFGPDDADAKPVEWIVQHLCTAWGEGAAYEIQPVPDRSRHEARYLKLDCSKAKQELGWEPRWRLPQAIEQIVRWNKAYRDGQDMRAVCLEQIRQYNGVTLKEDGG